MRTDHFIQAKLPFIDSLIKKKISEKSADPIQHNFETIALDELMDHLICEKIFYFKSKYDNFSFLGLGQSQSIKADKIANFLKKNPDLYLIASFLFEENPNAAEFILPEWSFINDEHATKLIITQNKNDDSINFSNLFFNTNFELNGHDFFIPPWISYEETPEHDEWSKMIESCDYFFSNTSLEKIVLSRKKIFEYMDPIEPIPFFKSILQKNNNASSSYAIFYQKTFGETFISFTPEKLFSIKDNIFESISVASSAPRGQTKDEDLEFESLLSSNEKLIREQNVVTKEIIEKITPLSLNINQRPMEIMKLPYIQHRATPISAILKDNITPIQLVNILHPTPAVGGLPSSIAQEMILELEKFKRSHYAAPIGIINSHFTELAVGIRSALIELNKITLFGGAGIVKGSTAEEEWNETAIKMSPYLKVINHE